MLHLAWCLDFLDVIIAGEFWLSGFIMSNSSCNNVTVVKLSKDVKIEQKKICEQDRDPFIFNLKKCILGLENPDETIKSCLLRNCSKENKKN